MKGLLKIEHVVYIGDFLVLSKQLGVNGCAIGGGQAEVKEGSGLLWLVEHSHAVGSESDGCSRGPLGMVTSSAENGKGIEFKELSFGKNREGNLLVFISNIKDWVGDGGDVTGVHGLEVFFSICGWSTSRKRVEHLTHGATLVLLDNIHAVLALVGEHQSLVLTGWNGDHGKSVSQHFVGKHVHGFHNLAFVVLRNALREIHSGDGQLGNIGDEGAANGIDLRRIGLADEDSNFMALWPAFHDFCLHLVSPVLKLGDHVDRLSSWCRRGRWV